MKMKCNIPNEDGILLFFPEGLREQLPVNYYLLRKPDVFKVQTLTVVSDFHDSSFYVVGRPAKPISMIL